jgi:hypothetical protein
VWIAFDGWASYWLGLEESKYEWAKVEKELLEHKDLEDFATDNFAEVRKVCTSV